MPSTGRLRVAGRIVLGFGLGSLLGWLAGLTSKMKHPDAEDGA